MTAEDLSMAVSQAHVARLHALRRRRAAIAANAFRLEDRDRIGDAEGRCHAYARYERAIYAWLNAACSMCAVDEAAE